MKKTFILLYLVILGILLYFAVNIFIERRNEPGDIKKTINKKIDTIFNQKDTTNKNTEEEKDMSNPPPEKPAYQITHEDCDNECTKFTDQNKQAYCQQVCGLAKEANNNDGCEAKEGLTQDYCWSNQAITEKDLKKCEIIHDSGIKKQCQNRITEDLMDEIM